MRPSTLRLTKLDDEIYQDMEETFPELRVTEEDKAGGVAKIDEERMKSDEGKKKWRDFIGKYENKGGYDVSAEHRPTDVLCHLSLLVSFRLQLWHAHPNRLFGRIYAIQHHFWCVPFFFFAIRSMC